MILDAIILFFFLMLSFKQAFSLTSFIFIKSLFSFSSLSAIRVVSSAYLRVLISTCLKSGPNASVLAQLPAGLFRVQVPLCVIRENSPPSAQGGGTKEPGNSSESSGRRHVSKGHAADLREGLLFFTLFILFYYLTLLCITKKRYLRKSLAPSFGQHDYFKTEINFSKKDF